MVLGEERKLFLVAFKALEFRSNWGASRRRRADILGSSDIQATLLAPTDAGAAATLAGLGLTLSAVTADPLRVTEILMYHLLPSNLQVHKTFRD